MDVHLDVLLSFGAVESKVFFKGVIKFLKADAEVAFMINKNVAFWGKFGRTRIVKFGVNTFFQRNYWELLIVLTKF